MQQVKLQTMQKEITQLNIQAYQYSVPLPACAAFNIKPTDTCKTSAKENETACLKIQKCHCNNWGGSFRQPKAKTAQDSNSANPSIHLTASHLGVERTCPKVLKHIMGGSQKCGAPRFAWASIGTKRRQAILGLPYTKI